MRSRHLQTSDISVFRKGLLAREDARETARHLLSCSDCRNLLPKPKPEEFWNSVLAEQDQGLTTSGSRPHFISDLISSIRYFRPTWHTSAFAGLLVIILTGFSFLLVSNHTSRPDDDLLATVPKNEQTGSHSEIIEPHYLSSNSAGNVSIRKPERLRPKADRGTVANRKSIPTELRYSAARGSGNECSGQNVLETATTTDGGGVNLRWAKVPKAIKYHLYISDDAEILIDEFESTDATSYMLKNPLDPKKSYKWKVLITLANGQVIVADSQKFTSGDIRSVQKTLSNKKQRSVTRCSGNQ